VGSQGTYPQRLKRKSRAQPLIDESGQKSFLAERDDLPPAAEVQREVTGCFAGTPLVNVSSTRSQHLHPQHHQRQMIGSSRSGCLGFYHSII